MISKEKILKISQTIKDFKALILKKFWVLSIYVILGAALGLFLASKSEKMFFAKTTFMLDGGKGGGSSPFSGLAKQFGIGGAGGADVITADKVVELIRAKRIVVGGLLMDATIDGKRDLLINHYLEKVIYRDSEKKPNVLFKRGEKLTFKQDSVLNVVYGQVLMSGFSSVASKKDGIITIKFNSNNEEIAIAFLQNTLSFLTSYFTTKSVEKEQKSVDLMTRKVDSILVELQLAESQMADMKDHSVGMSKAIGRLGEVKLTRKIKVLNVLYGEGIKNLEIARYSLMEKEVIFQTIDEARTPLAWEKLAKTKAVLIGGILAGLIGLLIIILKKQYNTIINA
ncbi:MAG: hypothetical protein NT150_15160 [Bacteroidetes bacterium]|nr:hypothetical protein [Bacteroidota bacterium]